MLPFCSSIHPQGDRSSWWTVSRPTHAQRREKSSSFIPRLLSIVHSTHVSSSSRYVFCTCRMPWPHSNIRQKKAHSHTKGWSEHQPLVNSSGVEKTKAIICMYFLETIISSHHDAAAAAAAAVVALFPLFLSHRTKLTVMELNCWE